MRPNNLLTRNFCILAGVFLAILFIPEAVAAQDLVPWGWGDNASGAIGDGSSVNRAKPVRVTALEGARAVRTGSSHTLAAAADGSLYAWGNNQYGQLGDGTKKSRMVAVHVSGFSGLKAFACGADHSLAVKSNGTVWCWGRNSSGQLGIGAAGDRTSPVKVAGLSQIILVRAGVEHSLALDSAGKVWAWGDNRYGQLGPGGPPGFSDVPVQVASLNGVIAIDAGGRHNLALKGDGSVWAWGDNFFGQLGSSTPQSTSATPVRVAGLDGVASVGAGLEHCVALKEDGTLWAWGANTSGQLGDGTVLSRWEPRQVGGIDRIADFAAGGEHNLALRDDGTLWSWGANNYSQLGDGTLQDRRSPVFIGDLAAVKEVRAGWDRSFAISEKRLTVASMKKAGSPFRIVITGAHFDDHVKVFIHGWQWPLVTWVNSQKLVLKGNESLKSSVPKDTLTEFRFVNPDGEELTLWWQWP